VQFGATVSLSGVSSLVEAESLAQVGASFTGLTVRTKVSSAVPPFESVTVTVIVATPN